MRFTTQKQSLLKVLSDVTGVVEARTSIPALGHVLFDVGEGEISLLATDLDIYASANIGVDMDYPHGVSMKFTIPARPLEALIRKLPENKDIDIYHNEQKKCIEISAGKSIYTLPVGAWQDFPCASHQENAVGFSMESAELRGVIDTIKHSTSHEETRYFLNGAYMHIHCNPEGERTLRFVTTDGHRLTRIELPMSYGIQNMPAVIIPNKTLFELRKILLSQKGTVMIHVAEKSIKFDMGTGTVLFSKVIDGVYPDYTRVIPQGNDKEVTLNIKELQGAVERLLALDKEKVPEIQFELKKDLLILRNVNKSIGTGVEEIPCEYTEESITTGFNAKYFMDALHVFTGDTVTLKMQDKGMPFILIDKNDTKPIIILMPIRI